MRSAFTIILNGKQHLEHNDFWKKMVRMFDYWIIVEGVSLPTGSTSWCKELPDSMHKNYLSIDGTTELLDSIQKCSPNVKVIRQQTFGVNRKGHYFNNKDEQVNAAITFLKEAVEGDYGFLWQIDVDEQWEPSQLDQAEKMLTENNGKTGCFLCDYFVGPNQQVFGDWGEGKITPYRRLWKWEGELFITHEPPTLEGKNGPGLLLPQRFKHYAYYFEGDVKFKEAYYQGYEGLYERWKNIQNNKSKIHVRELLGPKTWWSNTNTFIQYNK